MAIKNNLVKWAIGISSVLVFTGFVGVTQQQNQDNVAMAQNSQGNLNTDQNVEANQPQTDNSSSAISDSNQSMNKGDVANQGPNQNSQRIRTRAS